MARYRIVCTIKKTYATPHKHPHITDVGIVGSNGAQQQLSVKAVYAAMDNGDEFYTHSETSKKAAAVHKYECEHAGCKAKTLRSAPDHVKDNNLDELKTCT